MHCALGMQSDERVRKPCPKIGPRQYGQSSKSVTPHRNQRSRSSARRSMVHRNSAISVMRAGMSPLLLKKLMHFASPLTKHAPHASKQNSSDSSMRFLKQTMLWTKRMLKLLPVKCGITNSHNDQTEKFEHFFRY